MKKLTEKEAVSLFLNKFYDICTSAEANNYTLDEFYDDFPAEMHSFLGKLAENIQKETQNG